ncbi:hypothetical protein CDD83_9581 [Cordyceps sp. RAO-2017]|nr:hypothetical protein CDD83_9581 [Cordyceps sp. RAO-2017]
MISSTLSRSLRRAAAVLFVLCAAAVFLYRIAGLQVRLRGWTPTSALPADSDDSLAVQGDQIGTYAAELGRTYATELGRKFRPAAAQRHERRVHLLVPANRANSRLCRTVASAIVNDYPAPVIINWGLEQGDEAMNGYDMVTGKNWGVLEYLRELPATADDDIVIMVDAHDVIFQLPLQVLLGRYDDINAQATARLEKQHGREGLRADRIGQTIIMPSEKYCWPLDHRHPSCYAVPESGLRPDAYGPETDRATETNRPRWLNSGVIMGPVGDMRELYEWAHVLWRAYDTQGGDQDYFSHIYGVQELSRQRLRGSQDWAFGFGEHFKDDELWRPHMEARHRDYRLGLDLGSTAFQALNSAAGDLSAVVHGNATAVDARDREHGTADIYGAPFAFPDDLRGPLPAGFRARAPDDGAGPPGWRDVRLFSNFHARSVPALLHFNGDKTHMDDWWHRQWWAGQGREMLQLRSSRPGFAIRPDNRSAHSVSMSWDDLCAPFEADVFVEPYD